MRWWPVTAMVALLVCTALGVFLGVSQSNSASPPPSIKTLIAAFNAQYRGQWTSVGTSSALVTIKAHPVQVTSVLATTRSPMTAAAAFASVARDCNDGYGTSLVRAALVKTGWSRHTLWAVFVDPPGPHIGPSSGPPVAYPAILNWYVGFIDPTGAGRPFCSFGYSPSLPPLPIRRAGPVGPGYHQATRTAPALDSHRAVSVDWSGFEAAGGEFWLLGTTRCGASSCLVLARSSNGGRSFVKVGAPDERYPWQTSNPPEISLHFANNSDGYILFQHYGAEGAWLSTVYWTKDGGESWHKVNMGGVVVSPIVTTQHRAYALVAICRLHVADCRSITLALSAVTSPDWRTTPVPRVARNIDTHLTAFGSRVWLAVTPSGGGTLQVLLSVNGGKSFEALPVSDIAAEDCQLTATSRFTLWGFCPTGMMGFGVRSTDGGRSFSVLRVRALNSASIVPLSGMVAAYERATFDGVWLTRDGGRHFTQILRDLPQDNTAEISFADSRRWLAWAATVSGRQQLWATDDAGHSWTAVRLPTLQQLGASPCSATAAGCS